MNPSQLLESLDGPIAAVRSVLEAIEDLTHGEGCWADARLDPSDPDSPDRHGCAVECVCGVDEVRKISKNLGKGPQQTGVNHGEE